MEKEFECIKVKDGLYLASRAVAYDLQFLLINKFAYIVNCAAELPNPFDQHGIKYLKFKIHQGKEQHIFEQSLKRLKKMKKMIEQADQNGMCCLVHCGNGGNRSLVLITAYLMDRFKWKLCKAIQYLQSKGAFISLTEDNIQQLANLEITLLKENRLSSSWNGPYLDEEEELISKTFVNTPKDAPIRPKAKTPLKKQIIKVDVQVEKGLKRVQWQDRLDKEQRKEKKRLLAEKKQVERSREKNQEDQELIINKSSKTHLMAVPKERTDLEKRFKKRVDEQLDPEIKKKIEEAEIMQLIKKPGKFKKEVNEVSKAEMGASQSEITPLGNGGEQKDNKVYKLTINNYINPNINIIKSPPQKKKRTNKNSQKKDKFTRTYSQKQPFKKTTFYEKQLVKERQGIKEKQKEKEKRNAGSTPLRSRKQRKSQKEKDVKP